MGAVGGMLGLAGGNAGTGFGTNYGTSAGQLSDSYNQAQTGLTGQSQLLAALKGQNGLGNQSDVYNQLQGVVSGQGPNPAQAMLNQATGQNVANQAALAAGQRGAASNVGLMNRQAAQTGANLQQQAAGQGASMQAQQALGALGQAGNMANTMAGQQIGQVNQNEASVQGEQGILQGANNAANAVQGTLADTAMKGQQGLVGGGMNAAGAATGLIGGQTGLTSLMKAEGGSIQTPNGGGQSLFAQYLTKGPTPMAKGGTVKALVSPEEIVLTPEEAQMVADGRARATQIGEKIPGKAPVKGNSYSNDIVPKNLPEGGVVVPRDKALTKNPDESSQKFVQAVMSKKKVK